MIRIAITAAAFDTIAETPPFGSTMYEEKRAGSPASRWTFPPTSRSGCGPVLAANPAETWDAAVRSIAGL
jgi:hypothetical protein